jgi:hypothetical protein
MHGESFEAFEIQGAIVAEWGHVRDEETSKATL